MNEASSLVILLIPGMAPVPGRFLIELASGFEGFWFGA
jgi:hypothetical protein